MPEDSILIQISERDIIQSIQNMNSDSSPGMDGIYPKVMQNVAPYLIKPMRVIFNATLTTGTLPNEWITSINSYIQK